MTWNRREQLLHCPLFSCTTRCCKHVKELLFSATPVAKSGAKVLPFLKLTNFFATFFHRSYQHPIEKQAQQIEYQSVALNKKIIFLLKLVVKASGHHAEDAHANICLGFFEVFEQGFGLQHYLSAGH